MGRHTHYMRHQKTRAETRANSIPRYYTDEETGESFNLYRASRSPKNLPDSWDDDWIKHQKSWKKKRKTKYYLPGQKGQKYTIILDDYFTTWKVRHYCWEHDIPCKYEEFGGQKIEKVYYIDKKQNKVYRDITGRLVVEWIYLDPPEEHRYYIHINRQYRFTYWSKTEIDIEKICRTIP